MNYLTTNDIAKILDVHAMTIYFYIHPEKSNNYLKKLNENYESVDHIKYTKKNKHIIIDINEVINEYKVYDFTFINEGNFENRLKVLNRDIINKKGEYIKTSDVVKYIGMTKQMLITRIEKGQIKYKIKENKDFPEGSKGRKQYLYDKNDCIACVPKNKSKLNDYTIIASKQFFKIKEVIQFMKDVYNYETNTNTIRRRITKKSIEGIMINKTIRIPILEFINLSHDVVFQITEPSFNKEKFLEYIDKYVHMPNGKNKIKDKTILITPKK